MKKIVAGLLAVLVALGLVFGLLSAMQGNEDEPAPPVTPERNEEARQAPDPALQEFYDQTLDWSECDTRMVCASMQVPLDYAQPDGSTIEIAVLKRYADGDRQGSLVVNPGGPGAPGTEYARLASSFFRDPVTDAFDVVGFDPRGTGDSSPVDCLPDQELDEYLAGDPDPDDEQEQQEYVASVNGLTTGCVTSDPALAQHVSTIEAARDMDVLRAVLEEDELTYLGASYGTKLGATYADVFPDRTGRLVLDGGVDLSLSTRDQALEQARGFETALRAYVDNCLETSDSCFLGSTLDEGMQTISDLLDQLDEQPIQVGDRQLTEGYAFYGIAAPLYDRGNWLLLSTGLKGALGGDGGVLLTLADAYAYRNPDGSYADNTLEANTAINCLDDPSSRDIEGVLAEVPAFEEASPTLGRSFAWALVGCSDQQPRSTEEPRTVTGAGAPPILVVGTTRDPATPMKWSEALADQLESGVLVRRNGDGHTGYNVGNECVDLAVEDFLLEGTVPEDGLAC